MIRMIQFDIAYGYALQKNPPVSNEELFKEADAKMYLKKQKMKGK